VGARRPRFRYLRPELYRKIAGMLEARRGERERFIEQGDSELADEIARSGIRAEVTGRPKHLYSIYAKMRREALELLRSTTERLECWWAR